MIKPDNASLSSDEEGKEDQIFDSYSTEIKQKAAITTKVHSHQAVLQMKSPFLKNLFLQKRSESPDGKIVIDFKNEVLYEGFKRIVDYLYLDDLRVIDDVEETREMLEIIKLAKQYQLDSLFKACESRLKDLLAIYFDQQSGGILATTFRQATKAKEEGKQSKNY
jgi:hypothetical protein